MSLEKALIVDDSKSARYMLSKLLSRHRLSVDMVQSGEEALDYLKDEHPDVIFMDHMMPGMDGFQTVKHIKAQANLAAIPIIMYTSKEGEMYAGQAKALGATDVLAKPVSSAELNRIIDNLNHLHEEGDDKSNEPPSRPKADESEEDIQALLSELPPQAKADRTREVSPVVIHDVPTPRSETASTTGTGSHARKSTQGMHDTTHATNSRQNDVPNRGNNEIVNTARFNSDAIVEQLQILTRVVMALGITVLFGVLLYAWSLAYLSKQTQVDMNDNVLKSASASASFKTAHSEAVFESLSQTLAQASSYGYDQPIFGDERLALLQRVINPLLTAGFQGRVLLKGHVGEFCLTKDLDGTLRPASDNISVEQCDQVGQSDEEAQLVSGFQTQTFKDWVASLKADGITLSVYAMGQTEPRYVYDDTLKYAQAWNEVAKRNSRIEVSFEPVSR